MLLFIKNKEQEEEQRHLPYLQKPQYFSANPHLEGFIADANYVNQVFEVDNRIDDYVTRNLREMKKEKGLGFDKVRT